MASLLFKKVTPPSDYPVYHRVPLLLPACAALAASNVVWPTGSGASAVRLPPWAGVTLSGWIRVAAAVCVAAAILVLARCRGKHRALLLAVAFGVLLGTWRLALWRDYLKAAEQLAGMGTCETLLIIRGDPEKTSGGKVSFTARIIDFRLGAGETAPLSPGPYVLVRVDPSVRVGPSPSSSLESGQPTTGQAQSEQLRAGDVVRVRGRFLVPMGAMNPGEFDYRKYLASKRVFVLLEGTLVPFAEGTLEGQGEQSDRGQREGEPREGEGQRGRVGAVQKCRIDWQRAVFGAAGRLRERVRTAIGKALPTEEAALMQAVLLGDDSLLAPEDEVNLDRAGIGRFLNVTGFHVTLASWATQSALQRLTRRYRLPRIGAALAAVAVAAGAGWSAGAIRACVTSVMRTLAPLARREYNPVAGLSAAALACVWATPFPLSDVGFRLSFAASAGAFAGSRYCAYWARAGGRGAESDDAQEAFPVAKWGSGALVLISVALFALPLMALDFREVSLVGFALGGLWAAVISVLLLLAAIVAAVPSLMTYLGWFPYWIARGLRVISARLAALPWASLPLPAPSGAMLVCWYAVLALLVWFLEDLARSRAGLPRTPGALRAARRLMLPLVSAALMYASLVRVFVPWPCAVFLSVGQGDCAVLRYGDSVVMVDTGTGEALERTVLAYLRWAGIREVDLCVLSHLHDDHAGGIETLCDRVRVNRILTAPGTGAELAGLGVPVIEAVPGGVYKVGKWNVRVEPRDPGLVLSSLDANENCMIVSVWADAGRTDTSASDPVVFEFWGDAPSALVSSTLNNMDRSGLRIVKAPHHGSVHSLVFELYEGLRGGAVLVSVGKNPYGHPSPEVLDCAKSQGLPVWRTDKSGAVRLTVKSGKVYVDPYIVPR